MQNDDDEDDKPTVVVNINEIKKQLAATPENTDVSSLSFASTDKKQVSTTLPLVFFNFKTDYFSQFSDDLLSYGNFLITSELKELEGHISHNPMGIVVFHFSAAPKPISSLIIQIKKKYPQSKFLLCAENLSLQKAQTHQKTAAGAHAYLSVPFDWETLKKKLEEMNGQ